LRDERGTSGFVIKYRGVVIRTNSRTQQVVALSSAEAEILALAEAIKDAMLLRTILKEMGIDVTIVAWSDSTACILSTFRRGLGRLRHMDLRLAWLQDLVREHVLVMKHVPTERNTADVLTKSLPLKGHLRHTEDLGLHPEVAIIDGDDDDPEAHPYFPPGTLEVLLGCGVIGIMALLRILWSIGAYIINRLAAQKPAEKPAPLPDRQSTSASTPSSASSSSSTARAVPKSVKWRGLAIHGICKREEEQKLACCATCKQSVQFESRLICQGCERQIHRRSCCAFACMRTCGRTFCLGCFHRHWCPELTLM
jgi:hypothetical protein